MSAAAAPLAVPQIHATMFCQAFFSVRFGFHAAITFFCIGCLRVGVDAPPRVQARRVLGRASGARSQGRALGCGARIRAARQSERPFGSIPRVLQRREFRSCVCQIFLHWLGESPFQEKLNFSIVCVLLGEYRRRFQPRSMRKFVIIFYIGPRPLRSSFCNALNSKE